MLVIIINASASIILAALTMPSFIAEPRNVRAVVGDKVKFKLKFSGNPQPGKSCLHFIGCNSSIYI